MGLRGKGLVAGGCRGGLCEQSPAAAPCQVRASSSRLQKGPAAGQSRARERRWLCLWESRAKEGNKLLRHSSWERGVRTSPAGTQGSAAGGQEGLQAPQHKFPCGPWRGPWWSRPSPCSPWVPHGADLHAAAMEEPPWSRWMWPEGGCGPWEPPQEQAPGQSCSPWRGAPAGAGGLAGAAARGGAMLEQFGPEGWAPWYGPIWEQFWKSCSLWAAHAGPAREGRHPVGGTPRWSSRRE